MRFLIPDSELGTIMEKTDTVVEDVNINNDDKTIGGKHNHRKRKKKNCRMRNILQSNELIRKEVVRGTL